MVVEDFPTGVCFGPFGAAAVAPTTNDAPVVVVSSSSGY